MDNTLVMSASVGIDEDSPMRFRVCDESEVLVFMAGGPGTEFVISFETPGLRRFVALALTALSDVDALRAQAGEDTSGAAHAPNEAPELASPAGSR